jgi:hypothetical protein
MPGNVTIAPAFDVRPKCNMMYAPGERILSHACARARVEKQKARREAGL